MFMYNLEHIFTSLPRQPQNILFSLFGDLVTPFSGQSWALAQLCCQHTDKKGGLLVAEAHIYDTVSFSSLAKQLVTVTTRVTCIQILAVASYILWFVAVFLSRSSR
jgi:hypothetical protein